jgi:tryptophan synthase alpha chain
LEIVLAIARAGADLIELGIPFSDPLADGPTIQHSTQVALDQGMRLQDCLEMVAELRAAGVVQPLILMGYYNPVLAYGHTKFVQDASAVGVDGLIIPDLPLEEAETLQAACLELGLALIFLATPNSSEPRLKDLADNTCGFLYLVSLTGVTGARQQLPAALGSFIERARSLTQLPLAVGFGISTPEQAQEIGTQADGVIVGSALIKAVETSTRPVEEAESFVRSLLNSMSAHQ